MRFGKRRIDPVAEEQAFLEGVYSRMKPLLHKLILSQGATESEAEDILQEAFLRLWQKVEILQDLPERKCFNYVYTTVKNTALTYLGRKSRQGAQVHAFPLPSLRLLRCFLPLLNTKCAENASPCPALAGSSPGCWRIIGRFPIFGGGEWDNAKERGSAAPGRRNLAEAKRRSSRRKHERLDIETEYDMIKA